VSKEFVEEFFAPCGELHFAGEGPGVGVGAQDVAGHSTDHGEILWAIILAGSRVVLVEDDIERPVQMVVSRPEGFRLRPLSERCGSLSTHTAPIKQTRPRFLAASA
jgi:hypothetical protein